MSYDPAARRDTPLALKIKAHIRAHGAMPVRDFMQACLNDPEHGYYRTRHAIGAAADFITAPEISQVFGELIGLWAVVVWQSMGQPRPLHLVELGPGRGTMMRDMLRASARVAGFADAAEVHLIEPNPRLRQIQVETLAQAPLPVRHVDDQPDRDARTRAATVLVANEVLDCIPIDQFVYVAPDGGEVGWHVRVVDVDAAGDLQFGIGRAVSPAPQALPSGAHAGDILEAGLTKLKFEALARDHAGQPFAGLFIDYGHTATAVGDTLQAMRGHAYEHALTSPGEADLTAHVNFEQVAGAAKAAGFAVDGPVTQAEFLGQLGIIERASRLMAANPARAAELETGVARLMAPGGMGTRFKVIGVRSPDVPALPGFATMTS